MANVLIAGCGTVGVALGGELQERGDRVFGIRRDIRRLPKGIYPIGLDMTDRFPLPDEPVFDAVVFAASPDRFSEEAYRAVYHGSVMHLLEALHEIGANPRRLILCSTTSVYGQTTGEWVDETSPAEPTSFGGRWALEGERLVLESDYPATCVRFGGIYGPGRYGLADRVLRGEAHLLPDSGQFTNRVHLSDCAGILTHLIDLEDSAPVYLGVDNEPVVYNDVVEWLARECGGEIAGTDDPSEASRLRRANKRCSNRRLRESGYQMRVPTYREGYAPYIRADSARNVG